jgi:hypothetical protein
MARIHNALLGNAVAGAASIALGVAGGSPFPVAFGAGSLATSCLVYSAYRADEKTTQSRPDQPPGQSSL